MSPSPESRIAKAALTAGFGALAAGALHLSDPFLCVLACCFVANGPPASLRDWGARVGWAWAGAAAGAAVLVAFPQQPWFALPAVGVAATIGAAHAARAGDAVRTLLFVVGVCAGFPAGVADPQEGLRAAHDHGLLLTVACFAGALAQTAAGPTGPRNRPHREEAGVSFAPVGVTVVATVAMTQIFCPGLSVVATVAAGATALALLPPQDAGTVMVRLGGGFVGAGAGLLSFASTPLTGENLPAWLAVLCFTLGAFEAGAVRFPALAPGFFQAACMFAVVATALPGPATSAIPGAERAAAVCLGIALAGLVRAMAWPVARPAPDRR